MGIKKHRKAGSTPATPKPRRHALRHFWREVWTGYAESCAMMCGFPVTIQRDGQGRPYLVSLDVQVTEHTETHQEGKA
jgi:hypothetical protein